MNFWHMQLHPDNKHFGKEKEILEKTSLIGLGETKKLALEIDSFKNVMKIGDIVLIKLGKQPIALVKVESEVFLKKK